MPEPKPRSIQSIIAIDNQPVFLRGLEGLCREFGVRIVGRYPSIQQALIGLAPSIKSKTKLADAALIGRKVGSQNPKETSELTAQLREIGMAIISISFDDDAIPPWADKAVYRDKIAQLFTTD